MTRVTVGVDLEFLAEQRAWLENLEVERDEDAEYREGLIHLLDGMLEQGRAAPAGGGADA